MTSSGVSRPRTNSGFALAEGASYRIVAASDVDMKSAPQAALTDTDNATATLTPRRARFAAPLWRTRAIARLPAARVS